MDLFQQADQPQVEYTRRGKVWTRKKRTHEPRPEIEQPSDPFIRYIPLTQGQYAIVDTHLYEWLNEWTWFARWNETAQGYYASRTGINANGRHTTISMHRQIVGSVPGDGRVGDHQNGNTLNNCGANLRVATKRNNNCNRKKSRVNTSGFIGVYKKKPTGNWGSQIAVNNKRIHLGYFTEKEDAARAFDQAAIHYHGEFAILNFYLPGFRWIGDCATSGGPIPNEGVSAIF